MMTSSSGSATGTSGVLVSTFVAVAVSAGGVDLVSVLSSDLDSALLSPSGFFDGRVGLAVDNLADHDHFNRVPGLDSLPGTAEVEPHSPGRVKRVDSFS